MILFKLLGAICALVVIIYYYKGVNAWMMKPRWCLSKEDYSEFTLLDLKRFGPGLTRQEAERLNYLAAAGFKTWDQQGKKTLVILFYVLFTLILVITFVVGTQYFIEFFEQSSEGYQ